MNISLEIEAQCPFCNIGRQADRHIKRNFLKIDMGPIGGALTPIGKEALKHPERFTNYTCGVGRQDCSVLASYKNSRHMPSLCR